MLVEEIWQDIQPRGRAVLEMQYNFQWDPNKARTNWNKHGVSFRDAALVFRDPLALTLFDEKHSSGENRWITLGLTANGQYYVVVHTFEELEQNRVEIRIISARKATKHEIRRYEGD